MKSIHIVFVFLFGLGCQGALDFGPADAVTTDSEHRDMAFIADMDIADQSGTPDSEFSDASPDLPPALDLCASINCPDNSTCKDGLCPCDVGFKDDGAGCAPLDSCANTQCPYGATCNGGLCPCDHGFMDDGAGGCARIAVDDPATRSRDMVCTRWTTDHPNLSQDMWQVEPIDACDEGVLHPVMITDALRRTSLFRWLVGLPAVTSRSQLNATTQACATTLAASDRGLSHSLDETYTCYSPEAAQGAGSSNLAQGVRHPADSVNLYIGDNGVRSLGHRRWVFNPAMGATGFGQRGRYSCMSAFDSSSQANPEYVAYPAPGFFPRDALIGYWSFGSNRLGLNSQTTVAMTRTDTGEVVPVDDVYFPGGGYGIPVVAWRVPGAAPDIEYEVTIGIGAETRAYRTTLISCN